MNARERFLRTLRFQGPDHVPYYDEAIRQDTLERWYQEGLPRGTSVRKLFNLDRWETVPISLDIIPPFRGQLRTREDFERLKGHYDPGSPGRYPSRWSSHVRGWRERDHPLGIIAWPGFFQPLAVADWPSLLDILYMIHDDPGLLREMTAFIADFSLRTIERALQEVEIDFALFREPIASPHAPVISPAHFRQFVLPCYRQIADVLRGHGVDILILDTYGQVRELIPMCLEAGVNGLWCGGTKLAGMDYVALRKEFGRDLLLLGGINVEVLTQDKKAIEAEIMRQVPYLLEQGGYVPFVDGRVRSNVSFENYAHYRALVRKLAELGE